jgi:hypothetical protein
MTTSTTGVAPPVVATTQTTTATATAVSTDYEGRESNVIWSHDLDDKVRIRSANFPCAFL